MKRSCHALMWLFGASLVSLVTIGATRGQISPPSPGSKGTGDDEGNCPKPSTPIAFVLTESELETGLKVEHGWSDGPLGWLPNDDEYQCGLPSENPEAGQTATIATLVVQQAIEETSLGPVGAGPDDAADGVAASSVDAESRPGDRSDARETHRKLYSDFELEPLGFQVLGYASGSGSPADSDGGDVAVEAEELSRRETRVAAARESARVLRWWGAWLATAADRAERWADDQQAGEDAASARGND